MFSSVMSTMSGILPGIYHAIGMVVAPMAVALTVIWFVWQLVSNYTNGTAGTGWKSAGMFGGHMIKLALVLGMLAIPMPRLLNDIAITPVFNVGLTLSRALDTNDKYAECIVATAAADPTSISSVAAERGAFSPTMRHDLACELANVHQMTGLGMTTGWTLLNMAFDYDYMHKILWKIPIFPNIPIFFIGLAILVLFFFALLPVPMYFLEIFIELSMDLIMLPLMLLSWLFQGWKVLPNGKKNIQTIINSVVSGTLGIAATGIFLTFAIMFLNAAFGTWHGADALRIAIEKNDSKILMDGIMMNNSSLITITIMGIFIAMFMTMIPTLSKTLLGIDSVEKMNNGFYKTARNNLNTVWGGVKKLYQNLKK